jgi:hypothetical protein
MYRRKVYGTSTSSKAWHPISRADELAKVAADKKHSAEQVKAVAEYQRRPANIPKT